MEVKLHPFWSFERQGGPERRGHGCVGCITPFLVYDFWQKERMFSPLAGTDNVMYKEITVYTAEKNGDAHWVQIRFAV